jgi:uncharacterized membrane protein AbrB (regulator of aidB expression)
MFSLVIAAIEALTVGELIGFNKCESQLAHSPCSGKMSSHVADITSAKTSPIYYAKLLRLLLLD